MRNNLTNWMVILLLLTGIFTFSSKAVSVVIHVPSDYHSIAEAIHNTSDGDTIDVSSGTYHERLTLSNRQLTIGSSALFNPGNRPEVIFDGDGNGPVISINGGRSRIILVGLTITDGDNDGFGGGLAASDGRLELLKCSILSNNALIGGGLSCENVTLVMQDCRIERNSANDGAGTAIFGGESIIENGIFASNRGIRTAGLLVGQDAVVSISNSLIQASRVVDGTGGVGLYCREGGMEMRLTSIISNEGPGVIIETDESVEIDSCRISGNGARIADQNGAGIICLSGNSIIRRSTIYSNRSGRTGAGVFIDSTGEAAFVNCVIYNNTGVGVGGVVCAVPGSLFLVNSVIWRNSPGSAGGAPTIFYSDIEGGFVGEGNISLAPRFDNPEGGNFELDRDSPCLNAGISRLEWRGLTIVDYPDEEVIGSAPDLGVFESQFGRNVSDEPLQPSAFALLTFPNPFNSSVTITYSAGLETSTTRLAVCDISGRMVADLLTGRMPVLREGEHKVVWDAGLVGAGVYFVRLEAGGKVATQKILLLR